MKIRTLIVVIIGFCALQVGAQTLTATYVELADSADRYIKQERWSDAERVIVKALRHEPANRSNFLLWSNLGTVRTHLENYEGALEAFDIGLASVPNSTALLSNRARTYLAMGRTDDAFGDLDRALELDSTLQWPRKMHGLLLAMSGDTSGARRDFEIYRERFGTDSAVAEAEGDIAVSLGEEQKAIEAYREACELEPDVALLIKLLVTAHLYGRLEEQAPLLTEGLKKYPREGALYLMRAMLNRSRYQTSAMEHDLKTARDLGVDPNLYKSLTGESDSKKRR